MGTQIVVALSAVHFTVQKLCMLPLKQMLVSHSSSALQPTSATFFFAPASSPEDDPASPAGDPDEPVLPGPGCPSSLLQPSQTRPIPMVIARRPMRRQEDITVR